MAGECAGRSKGDREGSYELEEGWAYKFDWVGYRQNVILRMFQVYG